MFWWKRSKGSADRQFKAELRFHLDNLIRDKIADGLAPEEARRQAILEFGGETQLMEDLRDVHRMAYLDSFVKNWKYAFRFLRRSPTFSLTAIITLALAIGGNTAVFSAIDAVLLRPLPYPDANRLMVLHEYKTRLKTPESLVAPVRLEDWNRLSSAFQSITGYYEQDATLTGGALPQRVTEVDVAPRFLGTLGISPALGRDFTAAEERFGGPKAVIISNRLWRQRFNANPDAIGNNLRVGQRSFPIVGVLPSSFLFPNIDADLYFPVPADAPVAQNRQYTWYTAIGRLKPGITEAQGRADLDNVQQQLARQYPKTDADMTVEIQPLKEMKIGSVRRSLWLVFGAVSLLLLIACANIAALLLARAIERKHEISVRFSLGASRALVVMQLLTEVLALAIVGAALGLTLAAAGTHILHNMAGSIPRAEEIALNWRILLYALGCAVGAALLCGLLPAFHATRGSLSESLARHSRTQISGRNPLQWLLVGTQVALAVTLLAGAGLLLRSFQALSEVSPGFDASHVLTFHVTGDYSETANMKVLWQRIRRTLNSLRAMPGIEAAGTTIFLPGLHGDYQGEFTIADGGGDPEQKITADRRYVSAGYFAVTRIPLFAGAVCQEDWQGANVVVNHSFVATYFSSISPIGHHLIMASDPFKTGPLEIRGIVADAREEGLNRAPMPTVYTCLNASDPDPFYIVRTHGAPLAAAHAIREKLHQIEPRRSVFDIMPLEERISDSFAETRFRTVLLTLFAALALLLASVGLYGTLSYFVTIRQREIGLRLALGAFRSQIIKSFVGQGLCIAILGSIAGLCLAAALTRVLARMLYGVSPTDTLTFIAVAAILLLVAALASFVPAVRAARIDPMQVLRED